MNFEELTPVKQVKIRYWLDVIHQCRDSGLTNESWCKQNNVPIKQYYYWLSKIRKMALEDLPRRQNGTREISDKQLSAERKISIIPENQFVEVPIQIPRVTEPVLQNAATGITVYMENVRVEIPENTSPELLRMVLQVVKTC